MFESWFSWNSLDSLSPILGELSVVDRSRLEDPSTLSLAFTCLGTLAIFFAAKRVMRMVWPVQQLAFSNGPFNDQSVDEVASDGSSRGAA